MYEDCPLNNNNYYNNGNDDDDPKVSTLSCSMKLFQLKMRSTHSHSSMVLLFFCCLLPKWLLTGYNNNINTMDL